MLELALHYAERGWPVFPLVPRGKVPLISARDGGRGYKDATRDPAQLQRWWTSCPDANVGVATGKVSGLLVLDVDVKAGKPGLQSIQDLRPPLTFTVRTPTRGFHLYFRLPPGLEIGIGTDLLPGIDWRGTGGYVVGAGSVTEAGTYAIARQGPIADLPKDIAIRLQRVRRASAVLVGEDAIPEGRRDDSLMRMACALRRFGLGAGPILAALRGLNAELCRPPLPDSALERIAKSASRYPSAQGVA